MLIEQRRRASIPSSHAWSSRQREVGYPELRLFGLRFSRKGWSEPLTSGTPRAADDGADRPPLAVAPAGATGFRPLARLGEGDASEPRASMATRGGPAGIRARLGAAFTPSQPRTLGPLFAGRADYLRRLVAAVEEERSHVVLFGDRGRGKTSLANAFTNIASGAGYSVLRASCGSNTTFEGLFRGLLDGLPPHLVGPSANDGGDQLLPDGRFGAAQLTHALRRLRNGHVVFLIDEFDRVRDESLRTELAEAIKNVSDSAVPATFFVVGVAQTLDDLLGRHPSIQRNLVAMHLTRMTDDETRQLIRSGATAAGIGFAEAVSTAVVKFARGMPFYAQLLCLFAARASVHRGAGEVAMEDLTAAIGEVVAMQDSQFGGIYAQLSAGPGMEDMLYAAAAAETDRYGRFTLAVLTSGSRESDPGQTVRLLDQLVVRHCLVSTDAADRLYGFADPALAHYVLFRRAGLRLERSAVNGISVP